MAMTDFTIIRRSMLSRLFSTITTIVTVAVAVGLMLVLLSMRDAGRRAFERGSGNMHLLVSRDSSPLEAVLNGIFYAKPPQAPIRWDEYERLAAQFPLEFAIPVQQGDSYHGFPTLATTREFFEQFHPASDQRWSIAQGRLFEKEFQVVLGAGAAKETGLKLGDRIVLTHGSGGSRQGGESGGSGGGGAPHVHEQFKFEVVGILGLTGTSHDRAIFTSLNSSWILHAFDRRERAEHEQGGAEANAGHTAHDEPPITAADLTPDDKLITGIYLRVAGRPGTDATALLPSVFDTLRRDRTITVSAPSDQIRKLFGIVASINQIFLAMAAAVMVSSGIAIMLALYNSMEQRRRQIAVLRVLGCSRARIFGLVVTESALLGIIGGAAGFVLCVVGGFVVAAVMKQRLGLIVQPTYSPAVVLGVIVGTVVLASVAGLVPAVMAYRTSVAKNLKPLG
jgi:putative ABC transport system permease protein